MTISLAAPETGDYVACPGREPEVKVEWEMKSEVE